MYHYYKPLRNFSRKLDLGTSLVQIWALYQNLRYDRPLPYDFHNIGNGRPSVKDKVFLWELDILTREVILHAGSVCDKNLFVIPDFIRAFELIRKIPDTLIGLQPKENIFREVSRIYRQQSIWREGNDFEKMGRYLRIYSHPELHELLIKTTGMSIKQHMVMGVSITGHLLNSYWYSPLQSFKDFGISDKQRDFFWNRISSNIDDLRQATLDVQKYDDDWAYTYSPLIGKPMIRGLTNNPHMAVCPMPSHMLNRITEGLYFDLVKIKGFENPYGAAFEHYVGGVTEQLGDAKKFDIVKSTQYTVGKHKKHGVDWILVDTNTAILLECKTKQMVWDAKYGFKPDRLHTEIEKLASFVVQNYKNLLDILDDRTEWKHEGRELYPAVVTLGEFALMDPASIEIFEDKISELLQVEGIHNEVLTNHPFMIMSIQEYEKIIQVINIVGMDEFFTEKRKDVGKSWLVTRFMFESYTDVLSQCPSGYLRQDVLDLQADQAFYVNGTSARNPAR